MTKEDLYLNAYYAGRNSVHYEMGDENPYTSKEEREGWFRGRRHAIAEDRLYRDTEWD